ncbi:MAG: YkgJ family cysteine cluster protein, partial [Gemmatimonadetes bacterium]|nr:YkgJ family cysteine cluster protein [Gemmatimonadota bacterium]
DVTIPEVHGLCEAVHLAASDFTEMTWLETPEPARRIVRFPGKERYHRLRLKKVADGDGRRCVFLLPLTPERSLCSIYELRPQTCRTYPTFLTGGGVVGTRGGRFCSPGVWTVEGLDVRRLRAEWVFHARLQTVHDSLVDGWNERVFMEGQDSSEARFHAFSASACRELEALAPGIFRRPDPGGSFEDPEWPEARLKELVDQALRLMGWRTDESAAFARPGLGRENG